MRFEVAATAPAAQTAHVAAACLPRMTLTIAIRRYLLSTVCAQSRERSRLNYIGAGEGAGEMTASTRAGRRTAVAPRGDGDGLRRSAGRRNHKLARVVQAPVSGATVYQRSSAALRNCVIAVHSADGGREGATAKHVPTQPGRANS